MKFVYIHEEKGSFCEFSIPTLFSSGDNSFDIQIFMEALKKFGSIDKAPFTLPDNFLEFLSDYELKELSLVSYSENIFKKISKRIFVPQENSSVRDMHNFKFNIEYAGIYETVLSYSFSSDINIFHIDNSSITNGVVNLESFNNKY